VDRRAVIDLLARLGMTETRVQLVGNKLQLSGSTRPPQRLLDQLREHRDDVAELLNEPCSRCGRRGGVVVREDMYGDGYCRPCAWDYGAELLEQDRLAAMPPESRAS
jgi:hypothetical protein